jgi:hypothetical protein
MKISDQMVLQQYRSNLLNLIGLRVRASRLQVQNLGQPFSRKNVMASSNSHLESGSD